MKSTYMLCDSYLLETPPKSRKNCFVIGSIPQHTHMVTFVSNSILTIIIYIYIYSVKTFVKIESEKYLAKK